MAGEKRRSARRYSRNPFRHADNVSGGLMTVNATMSRVGFRTYGTDIRCLQTAHDYNCDPAENRNSQAHHHTRDQVMYLPTSRNIGRLSCRVSYERQVFGSVRLRHQRTVFAAGQAVPNPWRILVAGNADPGVERATA